MISKRHIYIFNVILAYVIRIVYLLLDPVRVRDTYVYQEYIKCISPSNISPSGYPFFPFSFWILGIPYFVLSYDIIKGAIILNMIIGLLIVFLISLIAFHLTKKKSAALLSGIIFATHPHLVHFSTQLMRENLYILFLLIAIDSTILFYKSSKNIYIICSGICCAFASFARFEGVELFIVLLFALIIINQIKWSKRIISCAVLCSTFLITVALFITFFIPKQYYENQIVYIRNILSFEND